ncbi:hypothetical protein Tco_0435283 [Tanacetum coccineum]
MITDVNVNKLHQPWRSFAAVINKCLSGKSTGFYDSLRLSQAQILWGIYHKKNVDYAYLLLEDFVYQVENKNVKRSNEMYYPRFTKVIVNLFMTKDQSIPRRNKLYGAILPDELTNEAVKDSESYKEYYAIASGAEPPKTKASVKKKQVGSDMLKTPLTKGKRLKTSAKAAKTAKKKQLAKTSKAKGLTVLFEVALTKEEQMKLATKRSLIETHSSHASGSVGMNEDDEDNDDDGDDADDQDDDDQDNDDQENDGQNDEDQDDEQTDSDNDGDDFVHPKFSTHDGENKEEDSFYPQVQTPPMLNPLDDEDSDEEIQDANVEGDKMNEEETNEEAEVDALYRDVNVNLEGRDTEMTDAPRTIVQTTQVIEDTHVIITPVNPEGQQQSSSVSSGFVSNMLNPSLNTCIDSLFNLNTESTSLVDVPVTTFAACHLGSSQGKVKAQVSKILLKIKKTVNEQLEAEVLTRSSNESKTSHAVAANLSELELKKILIDKIESNKRRDDEDKEPSAGSNRGSKRRRAGKEPESTSAPKEKTSKTTGKSTEGSKSHHKSAGESAQAEEPMHIAKKPAKPPTPDRDWNKTLPDAHGPDHAIKLVELDYSVDGKSSPTRPTMIIRLEQPLKVLQYPHDLRKPLPLIPNSRGRQVIPFDHFINNDLEYLSGGVSSQKYTTSVTKTKAADYGHIKWIEDLVPNKIIIAVTNLQMVEWHNYKHLDWITVRRDDDKLYKFKEGDFNRLRIQDIEDMLLLLVQGKLTNLTVEERLAFNVSL